MTMSPRLCRSVLRSSVLSGNFPLVDIFLDAAVLMALRFFRASIDVRASDICCAYAATFPWKRSSSVRPTRRDATSMFVAASRGDSSRAPLLQRAKVGGCLRRTLQFCRRFLASDTRAIGVPGGELLALRGTWRIWKI